MEADVVRRVALYGGSFDPPHNGHVLLATWALCRADLDELWLLPTASHVFGKSLSPFPDRCELITAAFSHLGPKVRIEPIEEHLPAPSYTIQTLEALRRREPDAAFSLVMGEDVFASRHKWKRWDDVEKIIEGRILVVGRAGRESDTRTPAGTPGSPVRFAVSLPDFSSTAVRNAVAAGTPWWWMVPEAVERLIVDKGLYR